MKLPLGEEQYREFRRGVATSIGVAVVCPDKHRSDISPDSADVSDFFNDHRTCPPIICHYDSKRGMLVRSSIMFEADTSINRGQLDFEIIQ